MRKLTIILTVLVLLALASGALAMSSAGYKLDWFTPMTGGGGGPASSVSYAVNLTIGQTVIGAASSANYKIDLGYWYGAVVPSLVFLPVVQR